MLSSRISWGSGGAGDTFRYQHVVQPHQLGVGRVLRVKVAVTKTCLFLDLAENGEERWLHPMSVDVALPRILEAEVVHAEDLVEDVLDVCVTLAATTTTA